MPALTRITDHVWMYPPHPDKRKIQPTVGVVIAGGATLLYDAGNGDRHACEVLDALAQIDAPPVRAVVYSHFHWDHIFGAHVFADHAGADGLEVIAHASIQPYLDDYAGRPWGEDYIRQTIPEKPWYAILGQAMHNWGAFRIVPPSILFSEARYRFRLGHLTLEAEHVGGKHSPDSVVLRVVDERVMFLSDSFYPRADGIDRVSDRKMTARLRNEGYAHYIDGHNGQVWRV